MIKRISLLKICRYWPSKHFKLSSRTKTRFNFSLKFTISVTGGHCDYSTLAPKLIGKSVDSCAKPNMNEHPHKHVASISALCRSRWPRGLRRGSAAARLLGMRVRIPPGAWMSVVSVVCCQVEVPATGRSLVQRESYRVWCV